MQKLDQTTEKRNRFANTHVYHSKSRIGAETFKDKCQFKLLKSTQFPW